MERPLEEIAISWGTAIHKRAMSLSHVVLKHTSDYQFVIIKVHYMLRITYTQYERGANNPFINSYSRYQITGLPEEIEEFRNHYMLARKECVWFSSDNNLVGKYNVPLIKKYSTIAPELYAYVPDTSSPEYNTKKLNIMLSVHKALPRTQVATKLELAKFRANVVVEATYLLGLLTGTSWSNIMLASRKAAQRKHPEGNLGQNEDIFLIK